MACSIAIRSLFLCSLFSSLYCTAALPFDGEFSVAFDNFRSITEGSWDGNTGAFSSLNLGWSLPEICCYGYGLQMGASYGFYDWAGRSSTISNNPVAPQNDNDFQQQVFVTGVIFRQAVCNSDISFGVVLDWMFNRKFGVFALDPDFGQVRFAGGYSIWGNEIGIWGTTYLNTAHEETEGIPVRFRAISQLNLFWKHSFCNSAETMLWAGLPYLNGLTCCSSGRPGKFIVGAGFSAPLSRCLNVEGHAFYMEPRSECDRLEARNYASNVCIGITYSFGNTGFCNRRRSFKPYLPVANNTHFIADTNVVF